MSDVKTQEKTTGEIAKDCDCKDSSRRTERIRCRQPRCPRRLY
jgi:hypothetical protein